MERVVAQAMEGVEGLTRTALAVHSQGKEPSWAGPPWSARWPLWRWSSAHSPRTHPFAFFSNSPVPVWIAIFAIGSWLLGQAINKWWWYFSADEHERKADDLGNLAGWALFMVVTPAWWVAARAGLLPQPNAMLLWLLPWQSVRLATSGRRS